MSLAFDVRAPGAEHAQHPAGTERLKALPVRRVGLAVDPARLRRFHQALADRLRSRTGASVSLQFQEPTSAVPSSLDLLLRLEAMLGGKAHPRLSAPLEDARNKIAGVPSDAAPDIVIDLSGTASSGASLRVLYDGFAGDAQLFGALLSGRMPAIEIEDALTGRILARGVPGSENARSLIDTYDCVLARTIDLIELALKGWGEDGEHAAPQRHSCRNATVATFKAKSLTHAIKRRLYHLCCYAPHWRTCWRFIDGNGVWETQSLSGTPWHVVPDPGFHFYADPFPFHHGGKDWIFVEDLDHRTGKGVISVVPFGENGPSGPAQPVLEEPWHLSYPFIFEHRGEIWMMPESVTDRSVRLYRAEAFPYRWTYEATLLEGIEASDATLCRSGNTYWMFAATRTDGGSYSDTLSLFSASDPLGPWTPHARNPMMIDHAEARPAGAVFRRGGRLFRPVQDCTAGYGTGIGLAEILQLDYAGFRQSVQTVLRPHPSWPGKRLHTLNRVGRLECIDGSAHAPRSRFMARQLEGWAGRGELA